MQPTTAGLKLALIDESSRETLVDPASFDAQKEYGAGCGHFYFGNLAEWDVIDSREYRSAIGIDSGFEDKHAVFSFTQAHVRYVLPALVLVAGMFKPRKQFLGYAFQPDFPYCITVPILDDAEQLAQIKISRRIEVVARARLNALLVFLFSFPSGNRLMRSIYWNGVGGRIEPDLGSFFAELTLRGLRRGDTIFVSSVNLDSLVALEEPCSYAANSSRFVALEQPRPKGFSGKSSKGLTEADLKSPTDQEWDQLKHLLNEKTVRNATEQEMRTAVGAEFERIQLGTSVKQHADRQSMQLVRRWSKSRHWYKFIDGLQEIRSARVDPLKTVKKVDVRLEVEKFRLIVVTTDRNGQITRTGYKSKRIHFESFQHQAEVLTELDSQLLAVAPEEFFVPLGFGSTEISRHEVYALCANSTRYLVPASLLIKALIPWCRITVRTALGIKELEEQISASAVDGGIAQIESNLFSDALSRRDEKFFSLVVSFPSMRRMLDSVKQGFAVGDTRIALPQATARLCLAGVRIGSTFYVQELDVKHFVVTEAPSDLYPNATRTLPARSSPWKAESDADSASRRRRKVLDARRKNLLAAPAM